MNQLEQRHLIDNTIIIFMSDNGTCMCVLEERGYICAITTVGSSFRADFVFLLDLNPQRDTKLSHPRKQAVSRSLRRMATVQALLCVV